MNWKEIKVASNNKYFTLNEKRIFGKEFLEVLKFHAPGLAPVKDVSGAYHINEQGSAIYKQRFDRTFGYYFNKAAVTKDKDWFHIDTQGNACYAESYNWVGNYQEDLVVVRRENDYFHLNASGERIYSENYKYAGDFKDGIACVCNNKNRWHHIDTNGLFVHDKSFLDLGVYHKGYAIARDEKGWFHIDKEGVEIYKQRYSAIEPFYNGHALVTDFSLTKHILNENGFELITV